MPSDTIEDPRAYIDGTFTEEQFLQQVKKFAVGRGWLFHHHRDSRGSDPGFPDCVMVRDERLVFAELKKEKGRLSKDQEVWLKALEPFHEACGVESWLWRPSDWDTIVELLT